MTIECPVCKTEMKVEEWEDGTCSGCGNEYYWDEQLIYDDDGEIEDSYAIYYWERYE